MTITASLTASTGTAAAPAPESSRPPSMSARDTVWSRALVEAEDGDPAGGMADWTTPEDAPMRGLTASGEAIMRQSAVAMTIGLVSPVVASASVQPSFGTPMPAASVERPDVSARKTEGLGRAASTQPKNQTRPPAAQRSSGSIVAPAALPLARAQGQSAAPVLAATPISALKAMMQAQLGGSVAMAASAADTLPPGGNPAPGQPSIIGQAAAPSDDLIARAPAPNRAGIVQLTALDLPAAVGETAEAAPADDFGPPSPPTGRTGIVQLTGLEGPEEGAEPEEAVPVEPDHAAPVSESVAGTAEPAERAPVRLYAEWSEQGVKVWLGTDAAQLPNLPVLAQQVQQWLTGQGERLLSLVCNGQEVKTETEAGLDFANNQSGEGWADRPLPRPASLTDRF
jgi:hypothetical protein